MLAIRHPFLAMLSLLAVCHISLAAGLPGDAESATHGDEAASLQVIEQVTEPNYIFRQYNLAVLSHYSYLIGSGGEAMVIDPARDIARYLADAKALDLKITRVYLTHSHADFVAGHMELAKATGAKVYVNKLSEVGFPHEAVEDGSEIVFGDVRTAVLTTPGHTPDGTCLAVYQPADSPEPKLMFTGDTLFIGSVGRPDLMGGSVSAAELATAMWNTWQEKLSKVPDTTKVYPAHGAGSLCGAHLSDEPSSTFGEQKRTNPYLQHKDKASFVMAMIDGLPEAPQYFKHNAALNKAGPPLVDWETAMPAALTPADVKAKDAQGAWLVDVRDAKAFADGHVKDALNIALRGRVETWVGVMIPWGEPLVLLGSDDEVRETAFRLHRIGYDKPAGYLQGGLEAWEKAGLPVQKVKLVQPAELSDEIQAGNAPVLVDVRLPKEWMGLRINESMLNLPLNHLTEQASRLDPKMPVLAVCNSAYRSSMAAGVLQKLGFKDVRNLAGGGEAWVEAGLPTWGAETHAAAEPPVPGVFVDLPERVLPQALAQQLMDLPGGVEVVDVRPAWQFAEYHLPTAASVPVPKLLSNPAYLVGKRPLVIVCRDGSISAAVAGKLNDKTERPVRYLVGGVKRYYDEMMRPAGLYSEDPMAPKPASPAKPGAAPAAPANATPAPAPAAPAPPPITPPKPKKGRAGC